MSYTEKTFVSEGGTILGKAVLPSDYEISGVLNEKWQGEMVPFCAFMNAKSPDKGIFLRSFSKDVHTDLRNPFLKTVALLVQQHTEAGYDKYVEPEKYICSFAENMAGTQLTLDAETDLHTVLSNDAELARGLLHNDKSLYDMFLELNSTVIEEECFSRLYRFTGRQGDNDIVVLAGMDWQYAQLKYGPAFLDDMSGAMKKLFETAREKLGGDRDYLADLKETASDFVEASKGMTMSDFMKGGILGKMMREKKNRQQETRQEVKPVMKEEAKEEKPARCDLVIYGAQRVYLCLCLAEKEKEALPVFMTFVRSIEPDEGLDQKENAAINRKMQLIRQQAAINQNIALQKTAQLRAMQARTSQMIANNARAASDGLMDSFNKKMASDSRISAAYSEATRGVNTYTNSYGQNVDVSVGADHVYENRYGDVYGISGVELDNETLNDLNWKKIG